MESFISELEQEARCSLCNDRFSEPKLLKCFHTFCKACIKRHAELNEEGNTFKCPECCTETSFPELKNVDELNPSVLHTRILKVLAFVESEKVCSVSESHSSASWYCFDCSCSLCDDCHSYHSFFTKTDYNHEVVSLSNIMIEDLEFILAREDNCKLHVGYKLDFFCQDCNANVCLVCQSRDHCEHKTVLSVKHSTTARAALDDQLKRLCIREQEMSSRVKVLEDIAAKTKEKGERTIREVKEKAKEIIERVQQKERELIQEIQEKIDKSDRRKKKSQCILNQAKSAQKYISQVIEKNLPSSQTRGVRDTGALGDIDLPILRDDSNIAFVVTKEYSRLLNADFGTLVIRKPNDTSYDVINKDPFDPSIEPLIDDMKINECQKDARFVETDYPEVELFKAYTCSNSSAQEIFQCSDHYRTHGSIKKDSRGKDSVYVTLDIEEQRCDDMKESCVRKKDSQAIETVESLTKDSTGPKYYETKTEILNIFRIDENEKAVKKGRKKMQWRPRTKLCKVESNPMKSEVRPSLKCSEIVPLMKDDD